MTDPSTGARLRTLPRVDELLAAAEPLIAEHGRARVVAAIRQTVDTRRQQLLSGQPDVPTDATMLEQVEVALADTRPQPPRRIINATGVVVHTNLGRAPLSEPAIRAVIEASGYCDLEYDIETGRRGSRGARLDALLAEVTGAEAGLVVNNAAAALVLVVATLATGRGVVVSRGELIEIGGSFRLPDILASAGARLIEVGTTNRTRAADYRSHDDVALLLKMHPSNYRIVGFSEAPSVAELADVANEAHVPLIYDVGSGLITARDEAWAVDEPTVGSALSEGADIVVASGDKLLGGPQAGLIVGSSELVDRCRRHPLARAMRLDKLRLAALVATLDAYLGERADREVPVWRMLTADLDELARRCSALADMVPDAVIEEGSSVPGGGSAPGTVVSGPLVTVKVPDADASARRLRWGDPPIVVRVERDRLIVDLRTVDAEDDRLVGSALGAC